MAANGSNISDGLFISGGSAAVFDTSDAVSTAFAPGQLGKIAHIREVTGPDPGDGTKVVQYVSRYATDNTAVGNGAPAFWADVDNFVVTSEITAAIGATTSALVAGVFGSSNPAAGSYGFIQVGGLAAFRMLDSTSASTTGAAGCPVIYSSQGYWKKYAQAGTDATTVLANLLTLGVQGGRLTTGNNATGTAVTGTGLLDVVVNSW